MGEKNGVNDRDANWINDFREAIRDCKLRDLGRIGYLFTWSNRKFGPQFIKEKLDRFLCSEDWTQTFQDRAAKNLILWCSDYNPMMMEVVSKNKGAGYSKKTLSRCHCEDMWSSYNDCKEIVKHEWVEKKEWLGNNPVQTLKKTHKATLAELKCWSQETFKGRKEKLNKLMQRIKELQKHSRQYKCGEELKDIEKQIHHLLLDEEIYWKQKSIADWLKEGDKNTKFFHIKTSSRKRKNRIWGIENAQGEWTEEQKT